VATTTIRVDSETHSKLLELGASAGATLMETVRDAAEALRRQRFARQVGRELEVLRQDQSAWAGYLADAASTEITDGVG
jgi:hypothetical protein